MRNNSFKLTLAPRLRVMNIFLLFTGDIVNPAIVNASILESI